MLTFFIVSFSFCQIASAAFINIAGSSNDNPAIIGPADAPGESTASSTMIHQSGPARSFVDEFTVTVDMSTDITGDYGFTLANLTVASVELFEDGVKFGDYLLENGNYRGTFVFEAGKTYVVKVMADIVANRTATSSLSVNGDLQEIPVPAAVWLFGSAMIGLFGFSRRSIKS